MWRRYALGLVLAGGLASLAQAQAEPGTGGEVTAAISSEQVAAARRSAFMLSAGTFGAMKKTIDSGAEVRDQTFGARALARWARTLPTMFPEGTQGLAGSKARPEVWTDRAGFLERAAAYAEEADKLAGFAQAGDKEGFAAQWAATRQACQACHDTYREPPPAG